MGHFVHMLKAFLVMCRVVGHSNVVIRAPHGFGLMGKMSPCTAMMHVCV